jgi:AdoMet-dependent rRNA methyltransferase SPB1
MQSAAARARSGLGAGPSSTSPSAGTKRGRRGAADFEVVPQEASGSGSGSGSESGTDSEDEFDMLDDQVRVGVRVAGASRDIRMCAADAFHADGPGEVQMP